MYWIDGANTKKTIAYRPNHVNKTFDSGFVSMFVDDKTKGDMIVRLCYENKKYFQWVKWGTQMVVKSEPTEGVTYLVDLTEEAKDAEEVKDVEEAEETEWEEGEVEVLAEVVADGIAYIELVITGPHDPENITGKRLGAECMVYDRQRVQRVSDRATAIEIMYPVRLGPLFCLNDQPWEIVVY